MVTYLAMGRVMLKYLHHHCWGVSSESPGCAICFVVASLCMQLVLEQVVLIDASGDTRGMLMYTRVAHTDVDHTTLLIRVAHHA